MVLGVVVVVGLGGDGVEGSPPQIFFKILATVPSGRVSQTNCVVQLQLSGLACVVVVVVVVVAVVVVVSGSGNGTGAGGPRVGNNNSNFLALRSWIPLKIVSRFWSLWSRRSRKRASEATAMERTRRRLTVCIVSLV